MGFKDKLDIFEEKMTNKYLKDTGLLIGVSIQVKDEEQDEKSSTRANLENKIPSHEVINSYCKKQQEESLYKCNMFDHVVKKYINDCKENKGELLCSCYANVTNYVVPFRVKNSDGPWFYIFFGHFLLSDTLSDLTLERETNTYKLDFSKVPPEYDDLKDYAEEFSPKYDNLEYLREVNKDTNENKNSATNKIDISVVPYVNFTNFKNTVMASFEAFLRDYFEAKNGKMCPNDELTKFLEETNTQALLPKFDRCESLLSKWRHISKEDTYKGISLLKTVKKIMVEKGEKVNEHGEILGNLKNWISNTLQLGSSDWIKEGDKLKHILNSL